MRCERSKAVLLWAIVAALCGAGVLWGIFGWLLFSDFREFGDWEEITPVTNAFVTGGEIDTEAMRAVAAAEGIVRAHASREQQKREGV